jgi:hypothetical protein
VERYGSTAWTALGLGGLSAGEWTLVVAAPGVRAGWLEFVKLGFESGEH